MVRPKKISDSLKSEFESSDTVPNEMEYIQKRPDEDNPISLPFISIETLSRINLIRSNTDFVGDKTDDSGNEIAEVFASDYDISFQIDIYSAEDSNYDAHEIGQDIEDQVLYRHSMRGPQRPFYDENGNIIDGIWYFQVNDSQPEDDLTMTPNLRRWRIDVLFKAYHVFEQDVDYIEQINYDNEVL